MEYVLELQNVSWQRWSEGKTHLILDNVSWRVAKGEHWAVLGLNGSGKTTLLNMINGYIWPSSGRVTVLGESFGRTDVRELRKRIGWVSSALQEEVRDHEKTEHLVVSGKYASIGLYEHPRPDDIDRAAQLMEQLDCLHTFGRSYASCSQGEKQKLLIARALMASPQLLILDEATNGLDFLAREALLATVQQLAAARDAPTILFVTHHIEEVLPVFRKTLLLQRGRVFAQGDSREVLTAEMLTKFFRTPVHVEWRRERPWLSLST